MDAAHDVRRPLGQVLVDQGLISADQLQEALAVQAETEKQLGEVLVSLGFISPGVVANGLAEQHGGPLKTEYGISAGFGDTGPVEPTQPVSEPDPPAAVLEAWRAAVEQRDAVIERFRAELQLRNDQIAEIKPQFAAAATRIGELEAQLAGRDEGGDSLRAALGEREEQLAAALARVEAAGSDAAERETLAARVQELETERQQYVAAAEELKASVRAQAQDLAELGAVQGRVAELIAERERQDAALAELRADHADLSGRLAEAEAALAARAAATERTYDAGSHLLFVPSSAGYRLLERAGPAPAPGDAVELEESPGRLVVTRLGPSPFGSSKLACAFLTEV